MSALGCFGIVAPLVVASTRFDKFFYRNLIGVWPLLAVGLAAVLASRRAGWIGLVLAAGACAVELGSLSLVLERPSLQRDNWRSATAAIGADARSLAIVTNRGGALAPLRVYRPHAYRMPGEGAAVREIVFVGFAKQLDFRPPAGFAIVEQRRVSGFAFMRLRSARPVDVTPHELAVAIRGLRVAVLVERGAGPPEG